VSVSSAGTQANGNTDHVDISADGRYVAFTSYASNLVNGDTNDWSDVFVHDRQSGTTTRVSVASDGTEGDGNLPSISDDGRYVAFSSSASTLVNDDTNSAGDLFVHDRQSGTTTRISVSSNGTQSNSWSDYPSISGDGQYVAFRSRASNLVDNDLNGSVIDIFIRDLNSTTVTSYLSGRVTDSGGTGISGVTISAGSETTTTSSNGSYTISGLTAGSYTIRASKTNCTFSPSSRSVSVPPDRSSQNFTADCTVPTYTVSGQVTDGSGDPLDGVTITTDTGATATTGSDGSYSLADLPEGTYTLTPTLAGYTFDPASLTVTVPPDASEQDFTGTADPVTPDTSSISGSVTDGSGDPLDGVTITTDTGATATTGSDGSYTLSDLAAGSYTLSASKTNCTFSPATLSVTVPPDATGQDFTATCGSTSSESWTFLLYMDGEDPNLYPHFQRALASLEALPAQPNLTIVALMDGPQNGDTRRMVVQPGGNYTPNVNYWDLGEQNVGDPQTLQDFISWGQTTYPADHYYLTVADHGNGNLGIAWDETSDDYLSTAELGAAIAGGTNNGQRSIDVLHYDACLMGLLENAYQVKDYADYLIFSQNLGWSIFAYSDYTRDMQVQSRSPAIASIVAATSASTTPRQFAETIAEVYHARLSGGDYPRTISVIDLSAMDVLQQAVNTLAQALSSNISSIDTTVQNTRNATQTFDSRADFSTGPEDDYVDLYDFARRLEQNINISSVDASATAVMNAVDAAVVVEYHASGPVRRVTDSYYDLDNAHGIAIYFPPRSGSGAYNRYIGHQNFSFTQDGDWDDFLKDYFGLTGLTPEVGETLAPVAHLDAPQSMNIIYLPMVSR
jgi:hypothetical protein